MRHAATSLCSPHPRSWSSRALFCGFVSLACLVAQPARAVPPPDPQALALAALEAAATQPVRIRFGKGFPTVIRANVNLSGSDAVARANSLLTTYADLFRQSDSKFGLELRAVLDGDADEIVSFTQTYAGLPVFDAALTIVNREPVSPTAPWTLGVATGRLLVDDILPLDIDVVPAVTAANAESAARSFLARPGAALLAETTLGIIDPDVHDIGGSARLAYRITLGGGDPHQLYVDAHTLAVDFDSPLVVTDYPDFDLQMEDANGGNASDESCFHFTSIDDWIGDEDGMDAPWSGYVYTQTMWSGIQRAVDWYFDAFNRRSYDGDDEQVELYVYAGVDNASYSIGCDVFQVRNDYGSWDTMVHEFTHAVIHHSLSNLVYRGQSGALNESYADTMAAFADPSEDWLHGEGNLNGQGPSRSLRDPSGNDCSPQGSACGDPDVMSNYSNMPKDADNDWGGVHTNSGIPNKAHYLISEGGSHNGVTVTGIGNTKAQRLLYLVLQVLPPGAKFADAALVTTSIAAGWADSGKNGFTAADACQVNQAWAAVELADSDFNCDGVPDSVDDPDGDFIVSAEDNCPNVSNPGQANRDPWIDNIGDACDDDSDDDGWSDSIDNCPGDFQAGYANVDLDGDGLGNGCDPDDDGDGVLDGSDNCPETPNPSQANSCGTALGDACDFDHDADGDGRCLSQDNCPFVYNPAPFLFPQTDTDGDGLGDACDACSAIADNTNAYTPGIPELGVDPAPFQPDSDGDGTPDACDTLGFGGAALFVGGQPYNPANPLAESFFPYAIMVTGSAGNVIEVTLPVCPPGGRSSAGDDDRVELILTGLENAVRADVLDENGGIVASSVETVIIPGGPAGRGMRFRPDCVHQYRLRFEMRPGFSGSSSVSMTIAAATASSVNPWTQTPTLGFPPPSLPADTDSDGIWDVIDSCPSVADPSNRDTDLDGNGNVCDLDDDGDGLVDTVETNTQIYVDAGDTGTNPLVADSDGDGFDDGTEVAEGTNPNDDQSFPAASIPMLGPLARSILILGIGLLAAAAASRARREPQG